MTEKTTDKPTDTSRKRYEKTTDKPTNTNIKRHAKTTYRYVDLFGLRCYNINFNLLGTIYIAKTTYKSADTNINT